MDCRLYKIGSWNRVGLNDVFKCMPEDLWIVFFGEVHEKPWIINCVTSIIEILRDRGLKFIGLEHFNYRQQYLLDSWINGDISWGRLKEEYSRSREGFNLDVYKPILEYSRGAGLKVVGLMPPRELAGIVARIGLEKAMGTSEFSDVPVKVDDVLVEYKGYSTRFYSLIPETGPMARLNRRFLLEAQAFKDTVMAKLASTSVSILGPGLVLTGWAHVEHNGTVPTRVRYFNPSIRYLVISSRDYDINSVVREFNSLLDIIISSFIAVPNTH